jgi:uncharacterized protein (TIGR03435 family)
MTSTHDQQSVLNKTEKEFLARSCRSMAEWPRRHTYAYLLGYYLRRTTIDQSGMTGRYDIHLEFSSGDDAVEIPVALPQIGLKVSNGSPSFSYHY